MEDKLSDQTVIQGYQTVDKGMEHGGPSQARGPVEPPELPGQDPPDQGD